MRRLIFPFAATFLFFLSCSKDSGIEPSASITSKTYLIQGINKLEASDAFQVWVDIDTNSGHQDNVRIEANENLHDHILVIQKNGTLQVELEDNLDINGTAVLHAYVTLHELNSIKASGSSKVTINDKITSETFEIDLSGSSQTTGRIESTFFSCLLSGGSSSSLTGMSEGLVISSSGGSSFGNLNFVTNHLEADLSGGSSITLSVNQTLSIVASGGSAVQYKGDGVVISQELTGGSTITKL